MKKILSILIPAIVLSLLSGCSCEHEWEDANCKAPKTCSVCRETEGESGDHDWENATCDTPKTCKLCAQTEGEVLPHSWEDATTETPKTCKLCGKTEGNRIHVDERFKTENCKELFGTWKATYVVDGETALGITVPGENLDYSVFITFTFTNDGKMATVMEFEEESFLHVTYWVAVEQAYASFEKKGFTREEADNIMVQQMGITIPESVEREMAGVNVADQNQTTVGVYYVYAGQIYAATDWDQDFDGQEYTFTTDGKLKLPVPNLGVELEFTREA